MASMKAAAAVLLLMALAKAQEPADRATAAGISVKAFADGGRFEAFRTAVGETDRNRVIVTVDSVREVDAEGKAVGDGGDVEPHAIQSFTETHFTIDVRQEDTEIDGVSMRKVSSSAPVGTIGELSMDALVLKEAGVVGPEGDRWEAAAGDLKWNIVLWSWSWCGGTNKDGVQLVCSKDGAEQVGAFVDVYMRVKGSARTMSQVNASTFDLGSGVNMELSNRVTIDGADTEMPPGYPRLVSLARGTIQLFHLRIPKFEDQATYDPLLRMSGALLTTTTTTVMTNHSASGISVQVQNPSGRFSMYSSELGEQDPHKVVVQLQALREVDARGNPVGQGAYPKHDLPDFLPQVFNVSSPAPVNLGSARANKVSFDTKVGRVGQLKVETFIVTHPGLVGLTGETWNATMGDVKWNFVLSAWNWCGCAWKGVQQKGAYIDLEFSIKGPADIIMESANGLNTWDLGGGVTVELTHMVEVDGVDIEMPVGFPRLETREEMQVFVVRVPKFKTSAMYDPLLRMSNSHSLSTTAEPTQAMMFVNRGARLGEGQVVLALKAFALIAVVMISAGIL